MKIHVHFNNSPREQFCQLNETLEVGQTVTVHIHDAPDEYRICPNGHCHAPNLSVTRIDEETIFVAFESFSPPLACDVKDLPPHIFTGH